MANKLFVIINSLKVPKITKTLLDEMKFLVPNYSYPQNPCLGGYRTQIPDLSALSPQLNLLNPRPAKFLGTPLNLSNRACNAHATICHFWPARLYSIYPHCLINSTIKKPKMCVSIFFLQILSVTFLILRRFQREIIKKCILVFMWSISYSCQVLMKPKFSRKIFEKKNKKYSIPNFMKIRPVGAALCPCVRTDGKTDKPTDMTKLIVAFSQFWERV